MSKRRRPDQPIEWNFLSFPVAFAFIAGGFFVLILVPIIPFGLLFVVFMFLTSYCIAHVISHFFRNRSLDKQRQRAEENERERRALAARAAAQRTNEENSRQRRRRRTRRGRGAADSTDSND